MKIGLKKIFSTCNFQIKFIVYLVYIQFQEVSFLQ